MDLRGAIEQVEQTVARFDLAIHQMSESLKDCERMLQRMKEETWLEEGIEEFYAEMLQEWDTVEAYDSAEGWAF